MAKIKYTTLVPDNVFAATFFESQLFSTHATKKGFELHLEGESLDFVEVHGSGLTYKNGFLTGGTITSLEIKDGKDNDYLSITNLHLKVTDKLDLASGNMGDLFQLTLSGNDKVVGSAESDFMWGGSGKNTLAGLNGDDVLVSGFIDTMTGNLGSDIFFFADDSKKVVITDFDAVGGGDDQDYVFFFRDEGTPRVYQDHDNVVLNFGPGHKMILLDVDRADFSIDDDFQVPVALAQ